MESTTFIQKTMTLLPLSCLCVIVCAWRVSCLPAVQEPNTHVQSHFGADPLNKHEAANVTRARDNTDDVMKVCHATDNKSGLSHTAVPSMEESRSPCGEDLCVCYATYADCSNRSLHYIPKFRPGVTSLDFSHNKPRNTERADFFDNFTDVVWLDFSSSYDVNFSSSTFQRLAHLTFIDLTASRLSCCSLSAVFQIPSLEVLILRGVKGCKGLELLNTTKPFPRLDIVNTLIYSSDNVSSPLPSTWQKRPIKKDTEIEMLSAFHVLNLTSVDMSYSSLSCESVATLLTTPSLQELRLERGTYCGKFDFSLYGRTNMTRLDLNQNVISIISRLSLPAGLKYLDVSYNKIADMMFLSDLPRLQVLDLRKNVLKGNFPVCLPCLQQLDLSDNELDDVSLNPLNPSCLPRLSWLDLHANRLRIYPLKILLVMFSYFRNLDTLDISGQRENHGSVKYKPEHSVRNVRLTSLNLADNSISFHDNYSVPADTFLMCPSLLNLSLANNDLGAVNEERFLQLIGHLVHLQQLSLRSTGLRSIPAAMFRNFRELKSVDLSHNRLFTVPDVVLESVLRLRMMNLSFNRITVIKETTFPYPMRLGLQHVDLSENPLTCSCEVLWFRSWLLTSPSVFAQSSSDYLCANLPNTPITSFSMTEQACLLSQETSKFIIATVSLIFLGLSSLTFVYRYRWHIRLVLHEVFRGNDDRVRHLRQHRFEYDVFVCYDSEDFRWVRDHLMPSLEEGIGLKLCLHYRDFIPGTPVVDNIQNSVVASKKMLMLFSRQFAQSPWCQFELQLCLTHAMDTQDVLIVVLLEDIPPRELTSSMMAVMKTTTYIEWADDAEARDAFWRRMGLALHEVLPGERV